jgi:hypothetical protein
MALDPDRAGAGLAGGRGDLLQDRDGVARIVALSKSKSTSPGSITSRPPFTARTSRPPCCNPRCTASSDTTVPEITVCRPSIRRTSPVIRRISALGRAARASASTAGESGAGSGRSSCHGDAEAEEASAVRTAAHLAGRRILTGP